MTTGTATNFDVNEITNQFGYFWAQMAVPGAGARATLHTDGTPDATAHPNAKHLGHTTEGWEATATADSEDVTVDEQVAPVKSTITNLNVALAANLAQTTDLSGVVQYIVQGFGTYATAAGYEQIQIGILPLTKISVALIWPTEALATNFVVFHLYSSANASGIANQIRRRGLGSNPVSFRGFAVSGRAVTDSVGNYWKMI
jgi:hypothetical protein